MKLNNKYIFDLNFVEERTQQIFDFHNFIDRCLVEMRDIHLLDCGCCKGVNVLIMNEKDMKWSDFLDKETFNNIDTNDEIDIIELEVNLDYLKFNIVEEVQAYCWKVYSILFKEKNRIESLYINEYKSLSPEFLVENFTYISLKNTDILIKHLSDDKIAKNIWGFRENENKEFIVYDSFEDFIENGGMKILESKINKNQYNKKID